MAALTCPACGAEWSPTEVYCPGCAQSVAELRAAAASREKAQSGAEDEATLELAEEGYGLAFPWGVHAVALGESVIVGREHPPLAAELAAYPGVGRAHARLEHRQDGLYVTDLESTNPTYVDRVPLERGAWRRLGVGQMVGFGLRLQATVLGGLPGPGER